MKGNLICVNICTVAGFLLLLVLVPNYVHVPLDIMRQRICGTDIETYGPQYERCHQQKMAEQCFQLNLLPWRDETLA